MRAGSVAALLLAGCAGMDPEVQAAARSYESYGRVDDVERLAPTDCRAPSLPPARMSASRDPETHGRKLYYLFAKNRDAYRMARELSQPAGQVLVKESWVPVGDPKRPGDRGPLFLMVKTGGADTDEGWIYATATPDGKSITSSGKLASCMECHQAAKYDRLFAVACN